MSPTSARHRETFDEITTHQTSAQKRSWTFKGRSERYVQDVQHRSIQVSRLQKEEARRAIEDGPDFKFGRQPNFWLPDTSSSSGGEIDLSPIADGKE